jgi:hypothetical protein
MNRTFAKRLSSPLATGVWSAGALAGLAGGSAEVAWIYLYGRVTDGQAGAVARGVTGSFFPDLAAASLGVPLGIAIHMGLAVLVGLAVTVMLRSLFPRMTGTALEPIAVVGALAAIWAMNFFVVLPVINPAFVGLVPYWVSLFSKVLFGIAAAQTLLSMQLRD